MTQQWMLQYARGWDIFVAISQGGGQSMRLHKFSKVQHLILNTDYDCALTQMQYSCKKS